MEKYMTKIILIRHGQSEYNLTRRYTGQTDVELTEIGRIQAEITGKYILENYKIDEIWSSDLKRAVDTAKPIADALGLEIKTDERLREIYAGDWQGMLFSEVEEKFAEEYAYYKANKSISRTPNGEGLCDVLPRVEAAVREIAEKCDGKCVLISTHNGPIMTLEVPMLGKDLQELIPLSNNSITEADYENGSFKVVKLGYDEHLKGLITKFKNNNEN